MKTSCHQLVFYFAIVVVSLLLAPSEVSSQNNIRAGCTGFFNSTQGVIQSPNYPNNYGDNLDCYYNIEVPRDNRLYLTFPSFSAEAHFDFLEVHDGPTTGWPLLTRGAGFFFRPESVYTSGNQALLHFVTDGGYSGTGWSCEYSVVAATIPPIVSPPPTMPPTTTTLPPGCGGTFASTSGVITSPNFPNSYYPNVDCFYYIEVPNGKVELVITDFETDQGYDVLKVYDGPATSSPALFLNSGSITVPRTVTASGRQMLVRFLTRNHYQYSGWRASFNRI